MKKVSTLLVATAAALSMAAAPAVAGGGKHVHKEDNDWNGAVNVVSGNQVQIPVGVCQNNIGLAGVAVPIIAPMFMKECATAVAKQDF
ncbi:hypothetical protein [Longimycelium tulufanense]|nr:hypothetical protein [Longimycelium tulufanense]